MAQYGILYGWDVQGVGLALQHIAILSWLCSICCWHGILFVMNAPAFCGRKCGSSGARLAASQYVPVNQLPRAYIATFSAFHPEFTYTAVQPIQIKHHTFAWKSSVLFYPILSFSLCLFLLLLFVDDENSVFLLWTRQVLNSGIVCKKYMLLESLWLVHFF